MTKVNVLSGAPAAKIILHAMSDLVGADGDLLETFKIEPGAGTDVQVQLTVNGVDVDVVATLTETWNNIGTIWENRAEERALELISGAGLTDLMQEFMNAEWKLRDRLQKAQTECGPVVPANDVAVRARKYREERGQWGSHAEALCAEVEKLQARVVFLREWKDAAEQTLAAARAAKAAQPSPEELAKRIARTIFELGDGPGTCQRIQFKGGTFPDETDNGGVDEAALVRVICKVLES